ncbi:MAG: hypothetical protein ACI8XG_000339 [Congregibacter sp.]|jgi:hypothetical protein
MFQTYIKSRSFRRAAARLLTNQVPLKTIAMPWPNVSGDKV